MELAGILTVSLILAIALRMGFSAIQDSYAKMRRESRNRITRLDGPMLLAIAYFFTMGCVTPKCTPLHPYKLGGMTIYPIVCDRAKMDQGCAHHDPNTIVNACAWRRSDMPNKCWIIAADDEAGKEAIFHEHAHCAGASENEARCSDWPGTRDAPEGQFCDRDWPRGL